MYRDTPTANLLREELELKRLRRKLDKQINEINIEIDTRENQILKIFEISYNLKWKNPQESMLERINQLCKITMGVGCLGDLNRIQGYRLIAGLETVKHSNNKN